MRAKRLLRALVVMWTVLVVGVASAEPGSMEKAKAHFIAGDALYKAGSYPEALREFLASYDFAPLPDLLLNAGQCYRKLGQLDQALQMYERYLAQTPKSDPWQPKVRGYIEEIHAQKDQEAARTTPPPVSAPVGSTPVMAAPTAPPPATPTTSNPVAAPTQLVSPALTSVPARSRPLTRRPWFWATLAGGAVVVGGAVAVGVLLGSPKTVYPTPALGSVPVR